jgi:hypothetical protein
METEQATLTRELNGAFRTRGDAVTITPGVQELRDLSGLLYGSSTLAQDPEYAQDHWVLIYLSNQSFA